ncbi:hypothetical protein MIS33_10825 [Wielerella bovis]|uniref:hypothetical protein n=1 Tax=Wielerella bovis TaxID=2917790 RepID=UPI0020186190|nr:hypothetical protein [Wielerella bovis]ULJ64605.1 hypothetical protein MIS33_10825 [Wielerella bovis]
MNKLQVWKQRTGQIAFATALGLMATSASADTLTEIGEKVASAINAFITVVTSIGMAAVTVLVAIQGISLAFTMIKKVR